MNSPFCRSDPFSLSVKRNACTDLLVSHTVSFPPARPPTSQSSSSDITPLSEMSSPSALSSSSALPPSSFLPLLRRQPSSSALLAALRTLQGYDHSLLLLDPYERDLAISWLNRLLVSDLHWLDGGQGEASRGSSSSTQLGAPSAPDLGKFEELQRFLVDESARLLEEIARSEATNPDQEHVGGKAGGGLEDLEPMERVFCFPFDFSRPNAVLKVKSGGADGWAGSSTGVDSKADQEEAVVRERRFVVTLVDAPLPPSHSEGSEAPSSSKQEAAATATSQVPASLEASSAVGVQTWAASIVLSDLLVTRPREVHPLLHGTEPPKPLRVAELGAGTGLVGIVCAHFLSSICLTPSLPDVEEKHTVTLTDYHPRVLQNLRRNVDANRSGLSRGVDLSVEALDWSVFHRPDESDSDSNSETAGAELDRFSAPTPPLAGEQPQYGLLLAADVVYAPEHATWLYATMSSLLARTGSARAHVLNARRSEGRFGEWGLVEGTDRVFGQVVEEGEGEDGEVREEARLRVLRRVEMPKVKGLGRSDERGHIWWTLGWR